MSDEWIKSALDAPLSVLFAIGSGIVVAYCGYWYQQQLFATKRYGMPIMYRTEEGVSYPFIGQLSSFLRYRPWDLQAEWHRRYGPVVSFHLLGRDMFSVGSPALIKLLLQSKIKAVKKDVANVMKPFLPILGTGIVTSEDEAWMKQRLKMSIPLRRDVLSRIPAQTLAAVQRLMVRIEKEETIALGEALRHLTLQVISGTFLSLSAEESDGTFAKLYLPIVDEANTRVWHPYRSFCFFLPSWWKFHWNVYCLNKYVSELIRRRWKERRARVSSDDTSVDNDDILDAVLKAYEVDQEGSCPERLSATTVRQFRDEMKTFMLAGHETSAAMMTWVFYELMSGDGALTEPIIQEANRVFGQRDWKTATPMDLPNADDLSRLLIAEASLRESLRKYSVVPMVARRTVEDVRLGDKLFIPRGSSVLINIQAVHWDPNIWPNPQAYDPTRFLKPDQKPDPFSFLPFIAGPRNCLGQGIALLESKIVISLLVQRFRFSLNTPWNDADPRHRYMVPVIPKQELIVKVQRR